MTYRFGRTSKARYAATVSGIPAYQTDSCETSADCGPIEVCVGGKCQPVSITAPSSAAGRAKPKRARKRRRKRKARGRRRVSSKIARARKCPKGMKPSTKPGVMCEPVR